VPLLASVPTSQPGRARSRNQPATEDLKGCHARPKGRGQAQIRPETIRQIDPADFREKLTATSGLMARVAANIRCAVCGRSGGRKSRRVASVAGEVRRDALEQAFEHVRGAPYGSPSRRTKPGTVGATRANRENAHPGVDPQPRSTRQRRKRVSDDCHVSKIELVGDFFEIGRQAANRVALVGHRSRRVHGDRR